MYGRPNERPLLVPFVGRLRVRASPLPQRTEPTAPVTRKRSGRVFFCGGIVLRCAQDDPSAFADGSLLRWRFEIIGEVAEDDLIERLVADEVLAEDGLALLRS